MKPEISIIMPVYNRADYVAASIASVRTQTFQNWELIVIDDASSDDSANIIRKLSQADSRIRFYQNDRNYGIHYSRNLGVKLAQGEYIGYLDSDDLALPERLAKQLFVLKSGMDMVGCSLGFIDKNGAKIGGQKYPQHEELLRKWMRYTLPVANPALLARRQVFETVGEYRFSCAEDYDFYLRAFDAGFKATNLNEALVLMRMHPENTGVLNVRKQRYLTRLAWTLHIERTHEGCEHTLWQDESPNLKTWWLEKRGAHHYRVAYVLKSVNPILCVAHLLVAVVLWPPNILHLARRLF